MMILRVTDSFLIDWKMILRGEHGFGPQLRNISKTTRTDLGLVLDLVTILSTDCFHMLSVGDALTAVEDLCLQKLQILEPDDRKQLAEMYKSRVKLIDKFKELPVWDALRSLDGISKETVKAVDFLLTKARQLFPASQMFSCYSCELRKDCKLWEALSTDQQNPDMNALRHADCPWREENQEEQTAHLEQLLDMLKAAMENPEVMYSLDKDAQEAFKELQEALAGGKRHGTDKTRLPSSKRASSVMGSIEVLANRLKKNNSLFKMHLGTSAHKIIDQEYGKGDKRRTRAHTEDHEVGNYRDERDVNNIRSSEHALDDAVFYHKMTSGGLQVDQFEMDHLKEDLYILLDTSGSMMCGVVHPNIWMCPHRGVAAGAVAAAVCYRAKLREGRVTFRHFDTGVSEREVAVRDHELDMLYSKLVSFDFSGGGTNLDAALQAVASDFLDLKVDPKETEFLLISDLESSLTSETKARLKQMKEQGVIVRTLYMEEGDDTYSPEVVEQLKEVSTLFAQFDSSQTVEENLFKILKRLEHTD